MEHVWKRLHKTVLSLLTMEPVVQTRKRRHFKLASQLRIMPSKTLHLGHPILPDLPNEMYLTAEYTVENIERLKELGLGAIGWKELISLLQADLVNPKSRLKTTDPTDTWHESFADLFKMALKEPESTYVNEAKQRIRKSEPSL